MFCDWSKLMRHRDQANDVVFGVNIPLRHCPLAISYDDEKQLTFPSLFS